MRRLTHARHTSCRLVVLVAASLAAVGCSRGAPEITVLQELPLDVARTVVPGEGVTMDPLVSWDGRGSLRVHTDSAMVVPVVELLDLDVAGALLVYEAKVRTENLEGLAYLEMRCTFPGRGAFYSRGLRSPLSGSQGWTSQKVRFRFRRGETPDSLRLSLVLTGSGTAWVDTAQLLRVDVG